MEHIARFADKDASAHVASSYYSYDTKGQLSQLVHSTHPTTGGNTNFWLAYYMYGHDLASRLTSIDTMHDPFVSFSYDHTDQLTRAERPGTADDEAFTYDANGNRLTGGTGVSAAYKRGPNNRLLQDATYRYEYDKEGNQTARVDLTTGQRTEYAWDYRNRLTAVTTQQPTGPVDTGGRGTDWDWGSTSGTVRMAGDGSEGSGEQTSATLQTANGNYYVAVQEAEEGSAVQLLLWAYNHTPANLAFSLADGTATAGQDYSTSYLQYAINSAWTGFGTLVAIPTLSDELTEGVETFQIRVWVTGQPQTEVVLTARILDPGTSGGGSGGENDGPILFTASVQPATEGNPVTLVLASPTTISLKFWTEGVSAIHGTDYTGGPQYPYANLVPGIPTRIQIPTVENSVHYHTKSFRIYVQRLGDPDSTIELEADIFDNDLPFSTAQSVGYAYDVFDRLVKRTEDADGAGPAAAADRFFSWENGQIALQFDRAAGQSTASLSHRYLYGPAVDQILADESVTSLTSPGSVIWPLADHLGTPRDLAVYDDSTGETTLANHRRYDSFGNLISETNGNVEIIVGFAGGIEDAATGKVYNRARWYDPDTARWLSPDPISFGGGDTNLYRYVSNSPTNYVDPSGLARMNLFGSGPLFGSGGGGPRRTSRPEGMVVARDIVNDLYRDGDAGMRATLEDRYNRIEEGKKIAQDGQRVLANIAPGLGSALDAAEAISGKDLLTDECVQLSRWERAKRAAYAFGPYALAGILGVFARARRAAGAAKAVDTIADTAESTKCAGKVYDVGLAKDLRKNPLDGTQVHHAPKSRQAESLVGDFNPVNAIGNEPAIRLPTPEHDAVSAAQNLLGAMGSARDLLAQDIRILRNNSNAPNSVLRELIRLNRELHPWDYLPLHRMSQ